MKNIIFKGCGTALITPFKGNKVNYNELEKILNFQIENKTDAIIICGTTGESATMSEKEKREVIKFTVDKVNKKIPVIAGTGSNNTKEAIKLSKYAEDVGADGLLLVTPYYNKTTQKGLIVHYTQIANSVKIPIILYNVPSRTGVNIQPDTVKELSKINNIVAIKEASGNISQIAEIANLCKKDIQIYSGNDNQIIPILSLGGIGVVSVLSNIKPMEVHEIYKLYQEGKTEEARKLQLDLLPLIEVLFSEVNPIPIKAAMNIIGFNVGVPRLPLIEASAETKMKIEKILK